MYKNNKVRNERFNFECHVMRTEMIEYGIPENKLLKIYS